MKKNHFVEPEDNFDLYIERLNERIIVSNLPSVQEQIHAKMFNVPMLYESELEELNKKLVHLQEPPGTNTAPGSPAQPGLPGAPTPPENPPKAEPNTK